MNRRAHDRRDRINVVDLFSGGGGWSEGAKQAAAERDIRLQSLGLNHWDIAIKTYNKNHPSHYAMEAELFEADPSRLVLDGVDILIASPECTHHSNARGGTPRCAQSRSQAYIVHNWTQTHLPKMVLIENVVEWKTWGPLYSRGPKKGTAIKSKKGTFYNRFCKDMKDLGYSMESKEVVAADYGAPTTRKRLFVVFTREDVPAFTFPDSTHTKGESWVPAKEIIDWELEGTSIFQRKKPLSDKTLDRIWHGIQRYCKEEFKPFLTMMYGTSNSVDIEKPLSTVTAQSVHHYLAEPLMVNISHSKAKPTGMTRSTEEPFPTQVTREEIALAEPHLIPYEDGNRCALSEAFLLGQQSGAVARDVESPVPTIATAGAISFVEPFLVKFYGTAKSASLDNPLPTVTCVDRMGIVTTYGLDVRFRMLQPHELSAAMGFPEEYEFEGTKRDKVKQIGNAVAVAPAKAIFGQALDIISKVTLEAAIA
jgi:DNA (cytosine-5)-methyltransferase 1